MNKDQVIVILGTLKTAYPRFYAEMSKQEMYNTIDLWTEMFKHENPVVVTAAVKNLISTFKFPPTIADIKDEMYKLTKTEEETPAELWNMIKKAIRNSAYYSYEEFQKLPDPAKKFVGSPNQLREWAIGTDYNDSVVKGQFFKQIEIIKQREKEASLMLPEVKNLVQQLCENSEIKLIGD